MNVNCINEVKNSWPLAYAECSGGILTGRVRLIDHLVLTACLQNCLLSDRLNVEIILSRDLGKLLEEVNFEDLHYTIGLLHDLGKASLYYLDSFISTLTKQFKANEVKPIELKFPEHEHVISLLLEKLALLEHREVFKALYDLIAKIISRHHTAMPGRHPNIASKRIKEKHALIAFIKTMQNMCNNSVIKFVEGLLSFCEKRVLCTYVLKALVENLHREKFCIADLYYFNALQSFEVAGLGKSMVLKKVYILVTILTGSLMIADNIAAEFERRSSDEGGSRLYVEYWKRELGNRLYDCLKKCSIGSEREVSW